MRAKQTHRETIYTNGYPLQWKELTFTNHISLNKNGGRCRDIRTQKACEQSWEVNIGPKIKQTTSI